MPLTWFAHQAPVLPLKFARPTWVDATAMCVGSMMPDMLISFSSYAGFDSHHWLPAMAWGLPLTVAIAAAVRYVIAPVTCAQLPDCGPFRLRSYAVLSRRRPAVLVTLGSAAIGIASHIVLDSFTHPGRWGVRALGYNDIAVSIGPITRPLASVFQMIGHVLGSAVALLLLWAIGRRRLLETWYGAAAVADARSPRLDHHARFTLVLATSIGVIIGAMWGAWSGTYVDVIQRTAAAALVGLIVGSRVVGRRSRKSAG